MYSKMSLYLFFLFYFCATSLYYSIYILAHDKIPLYFKGLFGLVFFLSIYGIYLILLGDDVFWQASASYIPQNRYLLWLLPSLLSTAPVYFFTSRGLIQEKDMKFFFVIMLLSGICAYYNSLETSTQLAAIVDKDNEEFTITCVYSLLSILPILVLFKQRMPVQFLFLSTIILYFMLSAKRGVIVLGCLSSLFLIYSALHKASLKRRIVVVLFFLVLSVGLYKFILFQIDNSPFFALRVEQTLEGYSSGRDEFRKVILNYFKNSTSTKEFFLGIGAQGTLSINYSYAHNDWFAILLEQGILGVFVYGAYWIIFLFTWIKSKGNQDIFIAIGMLFVIGIGKTLFSMYYLPITSEMMVSSGFYDIALGFFLGKAYPQKDCCLCFKECT